MYVLLALVIPSDATLECILPMDYKKWEDGREKTPGKYINNLSNNKKNHLINNND